MDRRQQAEEMVGAEWYFLTPQQRWAESMKLYLSMGGTLDPEANTQSPFFNAEGWRALYGHGRPGVRVVRRGGV